MDSADNMRTEIAKLENDIFAMEESVTGKKRTINRKKRTLDVLKTEVIQISADCDAKRQKLFCLRRQAELENLLVMPEQRPDEWKLYMKKYNDQNPNTDVCESIEKALERQRESEGKRKEHPTLYGKPLEPFEITAEDRQREHAYWFLTEAELRLTFNWLLQMSRNPRIQPSLEATITGGLLKKIEFETRDVSLDELFRGEYKKLGIRDNSFFRMGYGAKAVKWSSLSLHRDGPPCSYADYVCFIEKLRKPEHYVHSLLQNADKNVKN